MTFLAVLCYLGSESRLASTKEKHATPLQEQFSSIAVLQIQTRVLNKDWEHTFPVTRSFINVGLPSEVINALPPLVSMLQARSSFRALRTVMCYMHYSLWQFILFLT